jgi:hypothetical protein
MQQDRSTGWRLGTPRTIQFRFQVLGLVVGAILTVGFAKLFMSAYPVLALDQTVMQAKDQPAQWMSAMTYKFVGALRSLTDDKPYQRWAIVLGLAIGFAVQVLRKALFASAAYQRWRERQRGRQGGRLRARRHRAAIALCLQLRHLPGPGHLGLVCAGWRDRQRDGLVQARQGTAPVTRPCRRT